MPQITDPNQINKLAQELTAGPQAVVATEAPADNLVILPGGFITPTGVVKNAEVRELNGLDEEAIAKSGSTAKALLTILNRGLEKIGEKVPTKDDFDNMLSGDRDAILLGIRKVTFGTESEFNQFCPTCDQMQLFKIDLNDDVKTTELDNPITDRRWKVKIKAGIAEVALPNGITQKKIMENADKTIAELNTMILSGCLVSLNESPTSPSTVLELGIADRETLITEIVNRNPGPRLGEVTKACEVCGTEVEVPLSLAALFRL